MAIEDRQRGLLEVVERLARSRSPVAEWLSSAVGQDLRSRHSEHDRPFVESSHLESASLEIPEGTLVDRFSIVRCLGSGGMGEVYLARDTDLGRAVALKLIRRVVRSPEVAAGFLAEARATAAVAHPNIVGVYDVGVFENHPYLALQYIDGESLDERRVRRGISWFEALEYAEGIAEALVASHALGIVHCDVKPHNVLVDDQGQVCVVDFGLAQWHERHGLEGGTPAYMAPERWWGTPPDSPSDIWSLGATVYELISGRPPSEEAQMLDSLVHGKLEIPRLELENEEAVQLVAECLRVDPTERPTAKQVALRLQTLLRPTVSLPEDTCPYRGLEGFEARHSISFFGRETETRRLVERVRENPLTVVMGLSGVGKSSLVRAGLVSRLQTEQSWTVVEMRPGRGAIRSLANALSHARSIPSLDIENRLVASSRALNLELNALGETKRSSVLLVVDQLEEVFTHSSSAEQASFVTLLASASDVASESVRVVCTLRDDYLGRLTSIPAGAILVDGILPLRAPDRAALERAIVEPVRGLGLRFEPSTLVDRLVDEVVSEPARLPLLQVACAALWERRNLTRRVLTEHAYSGLGALQGALVAHAERVLEALTSEEVDLARRLLLQLVAPDGTRRVIPQAALAVTLGAERVLEELVRGRLVLPRRDGSGDGATFELVHECLATQWPLLSEWISDANDEVVLRSEIAEAGALWRRRGEDPEDVWSGGTLASIEHRLTLHGVTITEPTSLEYLSACRAFERRVRRSRGILRLAAVSTLAAVAVGSTVAAFVFRHQAQTIDSAAANLGISRLEIRLYDLDPNTHESHQVPATEFADLQWRLLGPSSTSPNRSGAAIDPRFVEVETSTNSSPNVLSYRVRTRGAPAYVEVSGRGRDGRACRASQVRLRWLPGHAESQSGAKHIVRLWVPTCAASESQLLVVPGGPYFSGGAGEPPSQFPAYVDVEQTIELPTFAMDRTEVSNAAFGVFARMSAHTGFDMPSYPQSERLFEALPLPDSPVGQIGFDAAVAYCRYMGKRLPTSHEWEKASRGGLMLAPGRPNPEPRRNTPWGSRKDAVVNIQRAADGYLSSGSVFAMTTGASPYGILNLSGNVHEWTSTEPKGESGSRYRVTRGGSWDSPAHLGHWTIPYENKRAVVDTDISLGFRCAVTK